jgi:hypothetical protein
MIYLAVVSNNPMTVYLLVASVKAVVVETAAFVG